MPALPTAETNTEPSCNTVPQEHSQLRVDYSGLLSTWKGQPFVLTGIHTLDVGLSSLLTRHLSEPPSTALSIVMVYHTGLPPTRRLTVQKVKYVSRLMAHGTHWSYHVPHHSVAALLIKPWNGLLKIWLWFKRVVTPCGVKAESSRMWYMLWTFVTIRWYHLSYKQIQGPGIKEWKQEWLLSLLSQESLNNIFTSCPWHLGLVVLVPKGTVVPKETSGIFTAPLNWKMSLPPGHMGSLCQKSMEKKPLLYWLV